MEIYMLNIKNKIKKITQQLLMFCGFICLTHTKCIYFIFRLMLTDPFEMLHIRPLISVPR